MATTYATDSIVNSTHALCQSLSVARAEQSNTGNLKLKLTTFTFSIVARMFPSLISVGILEQTSSKSVDDFDFNREWGNELLIMPTVFVIVGGIFLVWPEIVLNLDIFNGASLPPW